MPMLAELLPGAGVNFFTYKQVEYLHWQMWMSRIDHILDEKKRDRRG